MKYTVLVNKNNRISNNYLNKIDLIMTKNVLGKDIYIEQETYNNYLKLKEFISNELNIDIGIDTAYRDNNHQERIYNHYLETKGKDYCDKYVALVGYSEHHTGLAIDIDVKINNDYMYSDDNFDLTEPVLKKIHPYLHKFGFILRYPENKENITGYNYEPWHIRYVGEIPATIIYENNLTLEEYLNDFGCILYINKPKDITSFDAVHKISNIFGIKKVGHTGTLDPLATGVMLVCVGKATKIVELLTAEDKEYIAEVKLGIKTDTLDITGEVLETRDVPKDLNIIETLNSFKKTYLQEVPIYSAVKVNGKKLYDYARSDIEVLLPKREVDIKELEIISIDKDIVKIKCLVSKGTYIRSLINDIGIKLKCGAIMINLRRTKQGIFNIDDSYKISDVRDNNYKFINILDVIEYKKIEVDDFLYSKIKNGSILENRYNTDIVAFIKDNELVAIYKEYEKDKTKMKPWKML